MKFYKEKMKDGNILYKSSLIKRFVVNLVLISKIDDVGVVLVRKAIVDRDLLLALVRVLAHRYQLEQFKL